MALAYNENQYNYDHLKELSNSDWEIVDGEPDIRGWAVKNNDGRTIGEVADMLFDPETRKVRYLVVSLLGSSLDIRIEPKVLIPIGVATLYTNDKRTDAEVLEADTLNPNPELVADDYEVDKETGIFTNNAINRAGYDPREDGDVVIVPATIEQLHELPQYEKDNLTPANEAAIRRIFENSGAEEQPYDRNSFYEHSQFDTDKFYNWGPTTWADKQTGTNPPPTDGTVTPPHFDGQGLNQRELDEPKA